MYSQMIQKYAQNIYLAKYIYSKNALKTVLARLEAKIIDFLCFWQFSVYDGRRLYGQKVRFKQGFR